MTDEKLMHLVRDDDIKHLSELFERYHIRLYNYFKKITRDNMLSEDLTQSVFERIIHYRHTFGASSSFQAWIFKIAKNCLIDHHRSRKPVDNNVRVHDLILSDRNPNEHNEQHLANLSHMSRMIDQLKDEHREVIILAKIENLTYNEIGQALGLSEAAVKARVFRAMKSLRTKYFNKANYRDE